MWLLIQQQCVAWCVMAAWIATRSIHSARLPGPRLSRWRSRPRSLLLWRLTKQSARLGDPANYAVAAYEKCSGKKADEVWLPDENTARTWQE